MSTDVLDPTTTTELAPARDSAVMPGFNSQSGWELANRIGKAFAASSLVPQQYQGNVANCIVALEMANRMGASPLMVMQNLYIVHGNPGWSSKFLVACFNQCGRFSALRYEWNEARNECRAWAVERATGERLEGPKVSVAMAAAEGWSTKSGSKWKTMPELMLMYRSAAFFIRTYAPEISMGLQTDDEIIDMGPAQVVGANKQASAADVTAILAAAAKTPAKTALPAFDEAAAAQRMRDCTSRETLAVMADDLPEVSDDAARARLNAVWQECDDRLAVN
jgi:hypothetical protein